MSGGGSDGYTCATQGAPTPGTWLALAGALARPHLLVLLHGVCCPLPLRHALPLQLADTGLQLALVWRHTACAVADASADAASAACAWLRRLMALTAGLLLGAPADAVGAIGADGACERAASAALLLSSFSALVLALLAPCMLAAWLELTSKVALLRHHLRPSAVSKGAPCAAILAARPALCLLLLATMTVTCWFACEQLLAASGPLSCSPGGQLLAGGWWQA